VSLTEAGLVVPLDDAAEPEASLDDAAEPEASLGEGATPVAEAVNLGPPTGSVGRYLQQQNEYSVKLKAVSWHANTGNQNKENGNHLQKWHPNSQEKPADSL
jgi:hypothetical protein